MSTWTASEVAERLEEAASTLRRLPPVKVQGYFSAWPQILHDADDKRDWEADIIRLGPPSAEAISRMDETLKWCRLLRGAEYRLVWMKADKVNWKIICRRLGYSRATSSRHWVYALAKLAYKLNNGIASDIRRASTF